MWDSAPLRKASESRLNYNSMRIIIPGRLWIGNLGDLDSPRPILDAGAEAVVQLSAEEVLPNLPRDLIVCRFPLIDGEGNESTVLRLAVACVGELLKNGIPVLVCCSGGMSRSPTIAAAAVSFVESRPVDEVVQTISAVGPIDISPAFWNDVVRTLDEMKRAT
jgi:protein-tyrosine phosphatase